MSVWVASLEDISVPGEEGKWFAAAKVQLASDSTEPMVGSVEAWLIAKGRHDETLVANVDEDGACTLVGSLKNGYREADVVMQKVRIKDQTYTPNQNVVTSVTVNRPK